MNIEKPDDIISIAYTCTRSARFSAWRFDDPWLLPGETATIFGWWVADGENPLYKVRRDRDGDEKAVHRSKLLEYGTIDGSNEG